MLVQVYLSNLYIVAVKCLEHCIFIIETIILVYILKASKVILIFHFLVLAKQLIGLFLLIVVMSLF